MAENKTTATGADPEDYVAGLADEQQRGDSQQLLALMREVTGAEPKMWGPSMIGFGVHHYRYESGREGDTFVVGFAPRKGQFTLYGIHLYDREPAPAALLEKLGKHTLGKGCVYVKRLSDIDLSVLRELVTAAWDSGGGTLRGL